jgi:hypothetical protein
MAAALEDKPRLIFSSGPAAITRRPLALVPAIPSHVRTESCSDANHQLVFFSHAHAAMQHVCSFASLFSHINFEIELRIGLGECRRKREQSSGDDEWWHDEMVHRPSGECGERNLPCDSAVSPITALGQLILLSLLPLSRSRYAFPWPGTLSADALCCMFRG